MKTLTSPEMSILFLDRATDFLKAKGLSAFNALANGVSNCCESEIEKRMLIELFFAEDWHDDLGVGLLDVHDHTMGGKINEDYSTVLCPQLPIGPYRIDIAVVAIGYEGQKLLIAIECDGHDYHERTKQQASRDKKRDRLLQKAGWLVFRYTGSDIFRDGKKCAAEVAQYVEEWRYNTLPAAAFSTEVSHEAP
ncbi:DUF559 domain-containing protein [Azospirillum sp. TSA6c]|uniref:endonuclease domain-containing protein n=1 Tax=Azospirillum sp. TSA6c TaxID=709813 RepID=UPI0011B50614|nr:DUF559 domain-containing protein [Azospirillum sp. TSA6c]